MERLQISSMHLKKWEYTQKKKTSGHGDLKQKHIKYTVLREQKNQQLTNISERPIYWIIHDINTLKEGKILHINVICARNTLIISWNFTNCLQVGKKNYIKVPGSLLSSPLSRWHLFQHEDLIALMGSMVYQNRGNRKMQGCSHLEYQEEHRYVCHCQGP